MFSCAENIVERPREADPYDRRAKTVVLIAKGQASVDDLARACTLFLFRQGTKSLIRTRSKPSSATLSESNLQPTIALLIEPERPTMLLQGIDHVATITNNGDQLKQFYIDVFDATIEMDGPEFPGGPRMIVINLAHGTELNVFEIDGNSQADHQTPMFGRGRIDHIGLHAANLESFAEIRERLIAAGAADRIVTEFGRKLSIFFRDPDQMEGEVLVANPDADPNNLNFGTASPRFI